jgi:catechol 2,3-dioxygenase-like lactoylglutathione lyase family enzyme
MTETSPGPRGLDHLVIGVRDLDAAGALYEQLGFRVGARNRHPWGTENRIVQFPGSFLELITIGDATAIPAHEARRFSFGAFVRDALARCEGMSMLVLESSDSDADAAAFQAAGIGDFEPFFFERQAKRPDGSEVRVAFSLAFAEDRAAPDCGFFVCQQHEPQNFWNPAFQQHENGAQALSAVAFVADDPARHERFFSAYTACASFATAGGGLRFALPRGRIEVMSTQAAAAALGDASMRRARPHFAGFAVAVPALSPVEERLRGHGIACRREGGRLVVPPAAALGCAIVFEQG